MPCLAEARGLYNSGKIFDMCGVAVDHHLQTKSYLLLYLLLNTLLRDCKFHLFKMNKSMALVYP